MCPWEPRRLELTEILIKAGCNPITRNSKGQTVFEVPIEREYTSVVELLLSYNVPLPPDILPIALQKCSIPQMAEFMIRNGADVHSTASDGNTVLHLAITEHAESMRLDLVKTLIEAGCNSMAQDSDANTVLEAAMIRGYTSVAQYLLSRDITLPPTFDILYKVLQQQCSPQMIQLLARKCANDLVVMSESRWDTLLQLVHASYTGVDRQWVVEILGDAR